MKNSFTVKEKYSSKWPHIAIISSILTVLSLVAYIVTSDVLAEGYLRLAAFAFFSITLLSLFKIKDGQLTIEIKQNDDEELETLYFQRNRTVHHEKWPIKKITSVKISDMPNRSLYNDIVTGDRCVMVRRKNEADWIYFIQVDGRVIPLRKENAEALKNHIENILK